MPLQLSIGKHRRSKSAVDTSSPLPSPVIVVNDGGATPTSILRQPSTPSESTSASASGSTFLRSPRVRNASYARSDTIDSSWNSDTEPSTPSTSVSSLNGNGMCPLPESKPGNQFPFFSMTLTGLSTLSFIALPTTLRPHVLNAINRAWRKGISKAGEVEYQPEYMRWHKAKGCDGGVWQVDMKGGCWIPQSSDKVSMWVEPQLQGRQDAHLGSSKRIILYLLTMFAEHGYQLTSSFRTTSKESSKDTIIFSRCEPDPDPIFFGVAFHSSDRIWIIDAEADVGTALEDGIKASWADGIRDARVRERHCREIRLRGNPWNPTTHMGAISSRIIHLIIMKVVTHCSHGYAFVGSVNVADQDECEIPFTIYRHDASRSGTWGTLDHLPAPVPISERAAASMSIGK